ncbi:MAG: hypothetical protein ABWY22_11020 [Flavobacterium sp.]
MKKTIVCITLTAVFVMSSCQREVSKGKINLKAVSEREAWLSAALDDDFAAAQKEVKTYLFSSEEFAKLTTTPNVHHLRFVLGYDSGIISIDAVGVNSKGQEVSRLESKVLYASSNEDKLADLNQVTVDLTQKRTAVLNKHLLSPKMALSGIEAWQSTLDKVQNLNDVTSYDGLRVQHYALETEVVNAIIDREGVENVGLFLGLNSEGKLTTILAGLDKGDNIKKDSPASKVIDDIYDFAQPSPPATGDDH